MCCIKVLKIIGRLFRFVTIAYYVMIDRAGL